jgi:membrane associated rhomboid family serine protease
MAAAHFATKRALTATRRSLARSGCALGKVPAGRSGRADGGDVSTRWPFRVAYSNFAEVSDSTSRARSEVPVGVAPNRRRAEELALVLEAEGVPARVKRDGEGFVLIVPGAWAEAAARVLAAYAAEHTEEAARKGVGLPNAESALPCAIAISGALLGFFLVTGPWRSGVSWFDAGTADAGRILSGELWRVVTALTLHADGPHVLANALAGTLFFTAVFRERGPGLGFALVLLSGALGNLANALLQGSGHVSAGASTSVFGAVGLLGGFGFARARRNAVGGPRRWLPVAAGLALIAMLGVGERADIWGHLCGFVVGGALGLCTALALRRVPGPAIQWTLGAGGIMAILYCWGLAVT